MSVKLKFSDKLSSISPIKNSKYRNIVASILSPSGQKKATRKKKCDKSKQESHGKATQGNSSVSDINEPVYSSIEELHLNDKSFPVYGQKVNTSSTKCSVPDDKTRNTDHEDAFYESTSVSTVEPLYAVVQKKSRNTSPLTSETTHDKDFDLKIQNEMKLEDTCEQDKDSRKNPQVHWETETSDFIPKTDDILVRSVIEEQKEEISIMKERIREIAEENRVLRKHIQDEKLKQDSEHAQMQFKITQLEVETHKEVKCLSDRIQTLLKERDILLEQIQILHDEKKILQSRFDDVCEKNKTMVSPEFLQKTISRHEKLLCETRKNHSEEIRKLENEYSDVVESKTFLLVEVNDMKDKITLLKEKNDAFEKSEQEWLQEKKQLLLQVEEAKHIQQEAQNLLLSLLKVTETVAIERDILLSKASFQDHQQKQIQTIIVDYSMNIGRLQEHISNLNKEKFDEFSKLKMGELQHDENLKQIYGRQLDLLHSKVLNQNNRIEELENEKSKLESQLESVWNVACGKSSVCEENSVNFLNM